MVCLSALQVVHGELCARHVGLQHQGVVVQPGHHHLEVHKELGVRVGPTQLEAAGGHVRDVELI